MYYFSFVTEFCRKKPYHAMLLGIVVDEGQMRTSTIPIILIIMMCILSLWHGNLKACFNHIPNYPFLAYRNIQNIKNSKL